MRKQIVCGWCGQPVKRKLSQLLRIHRAFCNRSCYHAWRADEEYQRLEQTVFRDDQYFFTNGGKHEKKG